MKVKFIKTVLVLMLSVLCTQIAAQTVIREKVKIKPNSISLKKVSIKDDFPWDRTIPATGVFPTRYLMMPNDAGYFPTRYASDLWYDFNFYWTYKSVEVLEGSQYVKFHLATGVKSAVSETYDNVTSLIDPGDSFETEAPFWASFDEEYPPQGGVNVRIKMNDGWEPIYFNFWLERPMICRLVGSAYPEKIIPYQKNWISLGTYDCEEFPENIIYNIEIISGSQYGNLYDQTTGQLGKRISNISRPMGEYNGFCFIPENFSVQEKDSVMVDFTCSDPNVGFGRIKLPITPQTLSVTVVPSTLKVGETGNIIVKRINSDGSLSDLSSDTFFDVTILDGKDYGTIFVPAWNDTTDLARYILQGFQFIAKQAINDSLIKSIILVETALQIGDVKIIPGKDNAGNNKLKSARNISLSIQSKSSTQEFEYLWGEGVVSIGKAEADTFYVKARFDKPNFSAGDLLNVSFVKVDMNGNESNFPEGTLFEARVDTGCTFGKLITSAGEGNYFPSVTMPIQFQVNDSLTTADTLIVIKVGVPGNDGNTYLSYRTFGNINNATAINLKMNSKVMKNTNTTSVCSSDEFVNSINADAVAKGDRTCNEAEKCDEKMKAPTIMFNETHNSDDCSETSTFGKIDWDRYNLPTDYYTQEKKYPNGKYPKLVPAMMFKFVITKIQVYGSIGIINPTRLQLDITLCGVMKKYIRDIQLYSKRFPISIDLMIVCK